MTVNFYKGGQSKKVAVPGETMDQASKSEQFKHMLSTGWSLKRRSVSESAIEDSKTPGEVISKLIG